MLPLGRARDQRVEFFTGVASGDPIGYVATNRTIPPMLRKLENADALRNPDGHFRNRLGVSVT